MAVVQPGPFSREVTTPTRKSGVIIRLTRQNWPDLGENPLYTWRVFEKERASGSLELLAGGSVFGGNPLVKDGQPLAAEEYRITFGADADKGRIRFEADIFAAFNTTVSLTWF